MVDRVSQAMPVRLVSTATDGQGGFVEGSASNQTYQLAGTSGGAGATIAATTGTTPITNVTGGSYIFDVQFTGTSVKLQSLGSDGVTWRDITTISTSPSSTGVVIGQGASARLYNPNGTSDTVVFASLS